MQVDPDPYVEKWYKMAVALKNAIPDFLQLLKVQYQAIKGKAPHETGAQRAERDNILAKYDRWISETESLIVRFEELDKEFEKHLNPDYSQINGIWGLIRK